MKQIELIKELGKIAGLTDEVLNKIEGEEVPEEVSNAVRSNLFTIDSAKNNSSLKSHYTAAVLDAVDSKLASVFEGLELDDEQKSKLSQVKNTYDKIEGLTGLFGDKLKRVKAESAGKQGANDKVIEDLNNQMLMLKSSHSEALKNKEIELLNFKKEMLFNNQLSSFDFANETLPKKVNITTAKALINEGLATQGYKIELSEEGLILKTKDDHEVFEQNKKVSFTDFVTKTLANNGLLKASEPQKQPTSQGQQPIKREELPRGASAILDRIESRLAQSKNGQS